MARCLLWGLQSWGSGRPSSPFPTSHLRPFRDLTWYPISSVLTAWELLLAAAPSLSQQPSYLYDLVDVTRQVSIMCYTSTVQHMYTQYTGLGEPCPILVLQCRSCIQERGRGGSAHPSHNIHWSSGRLGESPCNTKRVPSGTVAWGCQGDKPESTIKDNPGTGHNGCRVEVVRVQCQEPDHALGTRRWPLCIPFPFFPGQILDYAGKQWAGMVSKYYIPRYNINIVKSEQ